MYIIIEFVNTIVPFQSGLVTVKLLNSQFLRHYLFEMSKFKEIIRETKIKKLMETQEFLALG